MSGLNSIAYRITPICFAMALNACSFSHSSESSSTSVESSSDLASSPSSLSSSINFKKYESDVVDYTYAYLKSTSGPTDYEGFQKGLGEIANDHGVSDWESDPHTYKAIGKALKKAGIDGVGYETFKNNFADGDAEKMQSIQDGYDSRK
ncbi:putative lipoprotein [Methylomonas sp. LL1]|uniref:putative lipoprotein n=1 Tax=Methylomonas sp. LL1 TaxID=2785785 RepID=UPI0018C368AE|nr:putative lipoprotein [Methylomonas sp. LL1]QPK65411.1 putative lipoprotein [Methylomonas sp. LL1]